MARNLEREFIGKSAEFLVASYLLKHNLEVYLPAVDTGIDLIAIYRSPKLRMVQIQIKSFKAYTEILGVKQDWLNKLDGEYFLIINYRLKNGKNEFLVLDKQQTLERTVPSVPKSKHDVKIRKKDREILKHQNLEWLISQIKGIN